MHQVQTDHQIAAFGNDKMVLFNENGEPLVTAERTDDVWTVHADGVDDVTTDTRTDAIMALTDHALAASPGSGYSTLVPHGLAETP